MPDSSGTWTNATQIAVAVYRGALSPAPTAGNGFTENDGTGTTIGYRALTPTTRPATLGTGWFVCFASHKTATNAATAPSGMTNVASGGATAVVHDTNGPVSTAWTLKNVTVNASGLWMEFTVQIAASTTVSRVGAAAAAAASIAIPAGHAVGDLIVIYAINDASATVPGLGSGFTSLETDSLASASCRLGYKIATVADAVTPVADFTGTPTSGTASLAVTFTDSSTNTPTSWAWDFGDGGTSSSQNPSHSYTTSGVYTVALTAINSAGSNTKTRTGYITVGETISYAAGGGIFIY